MPATPSHAQDSIPLETADTLGAVLVERLRRSPDDIAYLQYDPHRGGWQPTPWRDFVEEAARWQEALRREGLARGDRVALMLGNRKEWALFDLAAQGLGLVTVPLFTNDRAENLRYLLEDSGARLLLLETEAQWGTLGPLLPGLPQLKRVLILGPSSGQIERDGPLPLARWLPPSAPPYEAAPLSSDALATLVYTSGTTGRPKGVMLSHRNILWNISAVLGAVGIFRDDLFLSFLPLSHTLERTCGLYLPLVTGATVAFARSIPELPADLQALRPTALIAVPRILERIHARIQAQLATEPRALRALFGLSVRVGKHRFARDQGRAPWAWDLLLWPLLNLLVGRKVRSRLGGRLRVAVSGGAPLSPAIAELFLALGIPLLQGYGLTEASPVVSGNRLEDNDPASIGRPLPGVEVRIGVADELLVRAPSVMLGYWNRPTATAEAIDGEGWLHTGDQARLRDGRLYLTGRIKEVIVLANGEKVSPADLETAIAIDGLINQVLVIGEGRPFLTALLTLDSDAYAALGAKQAGLTGDLSRDRDSPLLAKILLDRIAERLAGFPGHVRIYGVAIIDRPWTIESGLMTATLKLRRARILQSYRSEIERLYESHR